MALRPIIGYKLAMRPLAPRTIIAAFISGVCFVAVSSDSVRNDSPAANEPITRNSLSDSGRLTNFESAPLPAMDARFQQTNGWIGADADYSVLLSPGRTLWLFNDTWVGSIRDGKRVDPIMINNSVAIQQGGRDTGSLRFVFSHDGDGRPASLIAPADRRGWFWPEAGAVVGKRLYIFLSQVEKTGAGGAFGFHFIGQSLGIVSNPQDDPTLWKVEQRKIPFSDFSSRQALAFGAAVLLQGDYLYIYATDQDIQSSDRSRHMVVARAPVGTVEDFSSWRFYVEGQWEKNPAKASPLIDRAATECSVSYLPALKRYILVYTENGLSPHILARTAVAPWGPWSEAATVYTCPEMSWDKRIFCYAAKAHPSLGSDNELVLSYVANSFNVWQVLADARLYWPRFVSVKVNAK